MASDIQRELLDDGTALPPASDDPRRVIPMNQQQH
jgi:hypothetical protein